MKDLTFICITLSGIFTLIAINSFLGIREDNRNKVLYEKYAEYYSDKVITQEELNEFEFYKLKLKSSDSFSHKGIKKEMEEN